MARIVWSPQAFADLEAVGDFLSREAPVYAQAFVDGAFEAVERLGVFPYSGRAVPEIGYTSLREVIYKGYRIFYVVSGPEGEEEIEILAVMHSTRQFGGGGGLEPSG